MRISLFAGILGVGLLASPAHAIVLDRMLEAAEELGYQVASEFEFTAGSATPQPEQVDATLRRVGTLCPAAASAQPGTPRQTRMILIAWSDGEYPAAGHVGISRRQNHLAARRAEAVEQVLRQHLPPPLHLDHVNMSMRRPHIVPLTLVATRNGAEADIKRVLEEDGAAPTDRYQVGLFGEYGQRAKVLVWVDCTSPRKPRVPADTGVKLAQAR